MWGASTRAQWQLTESLATLAGDPAVAAVALAVDLLTELDGDHSYADALTEVARRNAKPLAVLANIPPAIDPTMAGELRAAGIPGLQGPRTGPLGPRPPPAHRTPSPPPQPPPARPPRPARRA